jgi:putative ATP-binding cassette transporter
MINASLRDELTYPSSAFFSHLAIGVVLDDRICELLEIFGLQHLIKQYSLDTVNNWEDVLSMGEQQRVSLVRLILHKPAIAILDECTSAIDEAQQECFYRLLRSLKIAYISVGHRPELLGYHDTVPCHYMCDCDFIST